MRIQMTDMPSADSIEGLPRLNNPGTHPDYVDYTKRVHMRWLLESRIRSNSSIIDHYDRDGWWTLPNLIKDYLESTCMMPHDYEVQEWKDDTEVALYALRRWTLYANGLLKGLSTVVPEYLIAGDFADEHLAASLMETIALCLEYQYICKDVVCDNPGDCPICYANRPVRCANCKYDDVQSGQEPCLSCINSPESLPNFTNKEDDQ